MGQMRGCLHFCASKTTVPIGRPTSRLSIWASERTSSSRAHQHPGRRWAVKRHPLVNGREATFQHLVSEGDDEGQRLPDLRRCERIRWPRAIIDALGTHRVVAWANERRGDRRVVIALPDFTYAVILADRGDHIMLWTAYVVDKAYRRKQMRAERERSGGEDPLKG